jgi:hypothetical protein
VVTLKRGNEMADLDPKIAVPLILDEKQIGKYFDRQAGGARVEDAVLVALEQAMHQARGLAEQSLAVAQAIMADESHTVSARKIRVKDNVSRLSISAAKKMDSARTQAIAELARIAKDTSAPARVAGVSDALETEIRSALFRMPEAARSAAVAEAIKNGDVATTRAILTGPHFLTGMSHNEREMRRAEWRQKTHKEAVSREKRIGLAIASLDRGTVALVAFARDLTDTGTAAEKAQAIAAGAIAKSVEATAP